ncbi:hypothetical protein Tco_0666716 [Tanacetum coccineum]
MNAYKTFIEEAILLGNVEHQEIKGTGMEMQSIGAGTTLEGLYQKTDTEALLRHHRDCVWRPKKTDLNNGSKDNSGSWISKRVNYIDPQGRLKFRVKAILENSILWHKLLIGKVELTATIDGQVKTITKASLRIHLKLEDNGGVTTLPNSEIFEQLALIGQANLEEGQEWWNDDEEDLEDPSKQGRNLIEELDMDDGISLVSSTML